MKRSDNTITFDYEFTFKNGMKREFHIELDNTHLYLIQNEKETYPEWTQLNSHKCPNCTLSDQEHTYCPVAINLIELIDAFKDHISHEKVDVVVETGARKYMAHTSLQQGLSSLIGIYMVTGGCPVMEKLKPMVKYHLPFATKDETMYRVFSMYMLAQYFKHKNGGKADWDLKELSELYKDVRKLNKAFCKRLTSSKIKDVSINAVVILDIFADAIKISVDKDALSNMENMFSAYLK